ncbi:MAG: helix-turn-helix transcriptional regulator [Pseudomonadota bacterium]
MVTNLATILYAAAAAIIAFALAMSLGERERRFDQTIGFAAMMVALLAHVIGELVIGSGAYTIVPHFVGAELSVRMMLGPAILFYTRAMISPDQITFERRDWLALLGPALVLIVSLPFSRLSAEEKLALVDPATRDPIHFKIAVLTCTAGVVLFLAFTSYYLFRALKLQSRHRRDMMGQFASLEQRSLDWLRNALLLFSVAWVCLGIKQMLWVSGLSSPPLQGALALTEMLSIAVFAYYGLRQPALRFDLPVVSPTVRTPIITPAHMERTAAKLAAALVNGRLYAESDLSLRRLSDVAGVSKNHISETLSQHLGTNFFDFVNKYRIEDAQSLLADTDKTVLSIAFEVGFNARSTFNTAFKKHSGSTPSAFRTSAREKALPGAPHALKDAPAVSE